jgi:nicotinamidase-related amidase
MSPDADVEPGLLRIFLQLKARGLLRNPQTIPGPEAPAGTLKKHACAKNATGTALLVIDMQPGFITRGGNDKAPPNVKKTRYLTQAQVALIREARAEHYPIVFMEYVGNYGDTNAKLKTAAGDGVNKDIRIFKKDTDGAFDDGNSHKEELVDYLRSRKIGTLVVAGANGGACVRETLEGALDEHCNVIAYTRGIADFNYEDFIYPYTGYYTDLRSGHSEGSFQETEDLDDPIFPWHAEAHRSRVASEAAQLVGLGAALSTH